MINALPGASLSTDERRWLHSYRHLSEADRATVLAFAEFLKSRTPAQAVSPASLPEPVLTPAPPGESVIAAIKRLSASYAMLERQTMLHETAALMTQHVMQGRAASEVIAELESLFGERYRQYAAQRGDAP